MKKWSPWASAESEGKRRKYRVKMDVKRIEGLFSAADGGGDSSRKIWVEIRWKKPQGIRGFSALRKGRKLAKCVSGKTTVKDGMAEWREGDDASFDRVYGFSEMENEEAAGEWDISFHLCVSSEINFLNASVTVVYGSQLEDFIALHNFFAYESAELNAQAIGEEKTQEIGTARLNLKHLVSELGNDQPETLRKFPVVSTAGNRDAEISVRTTSVQRERQFMIAIYNVLESTQVGISCVQIVSVRDIPEPANSSSTSDSDASPEKQPSRRGFLSWRKKRKTGDKVRFLPSRHAHRYIKKYQHFIFSGAGNERRTD